MVFMGKAEQSLFPMITNWYSVVKSQLSQCKHNFSVDASDNGKGVSNGMWWVMTDDWWVMWDPFTHGGNNHNQFQTQILANPSKS